MSRAVWISSGGQMLQSKYITALKEHVMVGEATYVKGDKHVVNGTMPNNQTVTSNGTVPGISSAYSTIPSREGTGLQYTTNTSGTKIISICPPKGYYQGNGGSYINRPASDFGNALASQVLENCTVTSSNGLNFKGTMKNIGAVDPAVSMVFSGTSAYFRMRNGAHITNAESGYPEVSYPISNFGNAPSANVLSGSTFTSANGLAISGSMPNKTANGAVLCQYVRNNNNRIEIAVDTGYYDCSWASNKYEYIPYSSMASVLGITGGKILSGNTICGVAGTIPNKGAVTSTLNCGASYTIPAGYHNGSGKITANSLASQTPANAYANRIVSGYTGWVNGTKISGTLQVNSIVNFSLAAYSTTQIQVGWQWPGSGPYSGVLVCGRTDRYPTGGNDYMTNNAGQAMQYIGYGSTATQNQWSYTIFSNLSPGTTYYFTIWTYVTTNEDTWWSSYRQGACATTTQGTVTINGSQIWTVPTGVRTIDITCVGGGGGGAGAEGGNYNNVGTSGGGGAGGYKSCAWSVGVTPGEAITLTIGAGGYGGAGIVMNGGNCTGGAGGTTKVIRNSNGAVLCQAAGGGGGNEGMGAGNGGTGGGAGSMGSSYVDSNGRNGGTNGGNGDGSSVGTDLYGIGDGINKYGFDSSAYELFSGGGGGGAAVWSVGASGDKTEYGYGNGGTGGNRGGGNGGTYNPTNHAVTLPGAGWNSTGGGGGGGGSDTAIYGSSSYHYYSDGAVGGSGAILIRW